MHPAGRRHLEQLCEIGHIPQPLARAPAREPRPHPASASCGPLGFVKDARSAPGPLC